MSTKSPVGRLGLSHLFVALTLSVGGCAESIPPPTVLISRKPLKVDQIPATILKAATKTLRGVKFQEAWKNQDQAGTTISYELRGMTAAGKIRDVRLGVGGEVLETE